MFTMPYADIEARDHVEGRPQTAAPVAVDDTMAMTTFGPLGSYAEEAITKGMAAVAVRSWSVGKPPFPPVFYDDPGPKLYHAAPRYHAVNDNDPLAGKAAVVELNALSDLPGFVYLGSPYSLYRTGHNAAAYEVAVATVRLMQRGLRVYSPIAHGHFVSKHGDLPQTWAFWKEQCQPMIDAASSLVVLLMHGWQDSVGLAYEIEAFAAAGKPIVYVEPESLVVPREEPAWDAESRADDEYQLRREQEVG